MFIVSAALLLRASECLHARAMHSSAKANISASICARVAMRTFLFARRELSGGAASRETGDALLMLGVGGKKHHGGRALACVGAGVRAEGALP